MAKNRIVPLGCELSNVTFITDIVIAQIEA